MVSVPTDGATQFIPLTELIENLEPEKFVKWNQLWMMSDRRSGPIHPLIYKHPISKKLVKLIFLNLISQPTSCLLSLNCEFLGPMFSSGHD